MNSTNQNSSFPIPLEYQRPKGEALHGIFRDGKNLVVPRGADISRFCLCCGQPTRGQPIRKNLHESMGGGSSGGAGSIDDGVFAAIFAIIYFIALIIYIFSIVSEFREAKKRVIIFGLCDEHATQRTNRRQTVWLTCGAGILLLIVGIVQLVHNSAVQGLAFAVGGVMVVAGPILLIVAAIVGSRVPGVALVKEVKQYMWIKGAGEPLLSAQAQVPPMPAK